MSSPGRRTLVVLGGADGSIPTLEAARRVGLHTICVDMRTDAPGGRHADEFLTVSTRDVDRLTALLGGRRDLAGVLSPASDVNLPASHHLARALGLPSGLSPEALRASVDKGFFRQVCDELGLPGPGYVQGHPADVRAGARFLDFPLIVKPTDSSGGRGISTCATVDDLDGALAHAAEFSFSGVVIAEEYAVGDHYTAEALVHDGEVVLFGLGARVLTPEPHFVTLEHSMPGPEDVSSVVRRQLDAVCRRLGYRWGALNADVLVRPDGRVVLIEMGARPGGNGSSEMLGFVHGLDTSAAVVLMAVGERPDLTPRAPAHAVFRAFGAEVAGKFVALHGLDRVAAMPEVCEVVVAVSPGDHVEPYHCAGAKVGYVLVTAECEGEARRALEHVERLLRVEVAGQEGAP